MDGPFDQAAAEAAEARGDWATAIALVGGYAECYSPDHYRHGAHLWHLDLLARAGLSTELAELADNDAHARRRLDQFLFDEGRAEDLRARAEHGDKTALYKLVTLFRERGLHQEAVQAVADIDKSDTYAAHLARRPLTGR